MAEVVQAVKLEVKATVFVTGDDGALLKKTYVYNKTLSDGTGTNQVTKVWLDELRPITASSEDLDFGTGGLTDFQGADVVLPGLKVLWLENLSTTSTQTVSLDDAGTNPGSPLGGTSPTLPVGPGGLALLINPIDGYTLTDDSADRLGVISSASINYKILAAG